MGDERGRNDVDWNDVDDWGEQEPVDTDEAANLEFERAAVFAREVDAETRRLRVRQAARDVLATEEQASQEMPRPVLLDALLAETDEPVRWRVDGLWPAEGRVVLAAQFKAGKTTLRDNLIRSLVDGTPFLGKHDVTPVRGCVVVLDTEMSKQQLRSWLRDQDIKHADRVAVVPLRGQVAALNLLSPTVRTWWAEQLRQLDAEIVVLDCLRPILDALGLSEDKDAGRVLTALDALLAETGITEGFVNVHMGHSGERARGDTRLRDWPDAEWRLVREQPERPGDEPDPAAPRYLTAFGRDVDLPESRLEFDTGNRRLTLLGGNRRQAASERLVPDVVKFVGDNQGCSQNAIVLGVQGRAKDIRAAVRSAVDTGRLLVIPEGRQKLAHYVDNQTASTTSHHVPDAGTHPRVTASTASKEDAVRGTSPDAPPDDHDRDAVAETSVCAVCDTPLHPFLVRRGETAHSGCQPGEDA